MGPLSVTAAFCVSECAGGASRRFHNSKLRRQEAGCREEGSRPVCEAIPPYMSLPTEAEQDQRKKPESSFFAPIHK